MAQGVDYYNILLPLSTRGRQSNGISLYQGLEQFKVKTSNREPNLWSVVMETEIKG